MQMFLFNNTDILGHVFQVDTRQVFIQVETVQKLREARVGRLVALRGVAGEWLIGMVDKVIKRHFGWSSDDVCRSGDSHFSFKETGLPLHENIVRLILIGTLRNKHGVKENYFTRSILTIPDIDAPCYPIEGKDLESFMGVIALEFQSDQNSLLIGKYTLDENARAYINGNRFFQRHAAILGSTGSGKSYTVASILERAAMLPSANIIVFDLHGEYRSLKFARQIKVAGPDEFRNGDAEFLFLPYWLLDSEEMQSVFIDRSEFTAHNQVMVFQEAVTRAKIEFLRQEGKDDLLESLTIDSPVPFSMHRVIAEINALNEELVQSSRGLRQGTFYGQFSRLLMRLKSKVQDKRYGFLFQAPPSWFKYDTLNALAGRLLGFDPNSGERGIKVIDFSETPSDITPIIVGMVARLIMQIQFWMEPAHRHPVALVCDEAHLYLPVHEDINPAQKRSLETFERIAKEGRKYGIGLLVVSQRPSDVSATVLCQCNNIIALRLTNATDLAVVKKLAPDNLEPLMASLPVLDVGEAIMLGDAVLLPTRIKLDPPSEDNRPLGGTVDFWSKWSQTETVPNIRRAVENFCKQSRR